MRWLKRWDRWTRRAAAAVVLTGGVLTLSLATALHVSPPDTTSPSAPTWTPLSTEADSTAPSVDAPVATAVAADPFRPERSPPERRYVVPGNREDGERDRGRSRRPELELVGTATFTDRDGLAAVRLSDGMSRLVSSGSTVEGVRVVRVDEGRVVLASPDTTIVLRVETPGERGRNR